MLRDPEMRGPAHALQSALDRAEVIRSDFTSTIAEPEVEDHFAAIYVAKRFRLALPLAQGVAAPACLGRAVR